MRSLILIWLLVWFIIMLGINYTYASDLIINRFSKGDSILTFIRKNNVTRIIINEDNGGLIHRYDSNVRFIKSRNIKVILSGRCASACTMYLYLNSSQFCYSDDQAFFKFHAAKFTAPSNMSAATIKSIYKNFDISKMEKSTSDYMIKFYPISVKKIINKHGGLSAKWIDIPSKKLIRKCGKYE